MRKIARFSAQVLAVAAITLALDFAVTATLFPGAKRSFLDAEQANKVYRPVPHHHDLKPDQKSTRVWGNTLYPWQTDRNGFRTGECAAREAVSGKKAIFVIGDSFTEALGASYEESFAGLMACDAARQGKQVWNLGVTSYSPIIYHRKIRAAAEALGVRPAEVFVFLDLSDIDDEANVYRVADDGTVRYIMDYDRGWQFDVGQFLFDNTMTARLLYDLYLRSPLAYRMALNRYRARWSVDFGLMNKWGWRGLDNAGANLDKIVALCREWNCRFTLVIYPWPDNVDVGDKEGIHVRHWRSWAAQRGVRFVDAFPPFFREPAKVAIPKYFIAGDVHFNTAGHKLMFDELQRATGGDW